MMPKILLVVACLYVAQAALISPPQKVVPVGEEKDDSVNAEVAMDFDIAQMTSGNELARNSPFVCNNRECQRFCRNRGWRNGNCINRNQCRCSGSWLAIVDGQDDVSEKVDENVANTEVAANFDIEEMAKENNLGLQGRSSPLALCNNRECQRVCRNRGWGSGRCVDRNTCRCFRSRLAIFDDDVEEMALNENYNEVDNKENVEVPEAASNVMVEEAANELEDVAEPVEDIPTQDTSSARISPFAFVCNNSECKRTCRNKGFKNGKCLSKYSCYCSGKW